MGQGHASDSALRRLAATAPAPIRPPGLGTPISHGCGPKKPIIIITIKRCLSKERAENLEGIYPVNACLIVCVCVCVLAKRKE